MESHGLEKRWQLEVQSMKKVNDGTKIQDKLYSAMKSYVSTNPGFVYRFYDTKSAGSYLPAQPGDFFLLVPGGCLLIECKSSASGIQLLTMAHKSKVQIAKHRLWHRAQHYSLYVYHDTRNDKVEWHLGSYVVNKMNNPRWLGRLSNLEDSLSSVLESLNMGAGHELLSR